MGRFHRHDDGTVHEHHHGDHPHDHSHHDHSPHDHGDHSGYETGRERIEVLEDIFAENDHCAAHNREAFDAHNVQAINVMSSPGSGKTTVLQHVLAAAQAAGIRTGVIEGDIETSLDADRLGGYGAQISLLNTGNGFGGECHLDAPMVAAALSRLDLSALDLVLIENVGNLVCPAEFEVGEHRKLMVYAVTEGEDKPLKYPLIFKESAVALLNKVDILPYTNFDMEAAERDITALHPGIEVLPVSCRTGEGLDVWYDWLRAQVRAKKKQA